MTISKVLCVDDSDTDLTNIKNIVSNAGYVVVTASSGAEAIEKAGADKPDLIFMDVIMDNTDGFEACRTLTGSPETKHIPIVFTTSKSQKADRVWAELQGGKALISKPYTSEDIVSHIKHY